MFLLFNKISTAHPSQTVPIIISSDAILTVGTEIFEDKGMNGDYVATKVEVIGFPKYTFHTLTPYQTVINQLGTITIANGTAGTGSTCAGDNNVMDIVYPTIRYPFIEASMVFNNTITESVKYTFNSNFLVIAEPMFFNDSYHLDQRTATMIVLRDTHPKKVMTKLDFTELVALLNPTAV